jgi:hypothetical protein
VSSSRRRTTWPARSANPGASGPTGTTGGGSLEDLDEIIAEFLVESHENLDQLDSDVVLE